MNTFLKNLWLFAGYGAMVIGYFYLMNWSLKWFVEFRHTARNRKRDNKRRKEYDKDLVSWTKLEQYYWKEIVAIPIYFLTWCPVILIVFAFIGGFFYLIYELLCMMLKLVG